MKETIYREDAIKCVANLYREWNGCEGEYFAHKALDDLPSAVIGRVGEWIDRSDGGRILNPWWETYECSKCGQYGTRIWNYCPNCGSKMRGEHDD